ncbi:efflux RND transporter periplasmic adaptor subunit [Caulobacter sp. 17J65-9]|uniref:efflux RND transporter periplasmic adaptor subunit n=1 Tax=Caulobacter sp. 17J65-9 TaxID=2709382 RepID=UPI0013CD4BA1|nr:efflux RND transporter periplasmic adaptor subunit [Caulobacter sp. 17J65-9]NEX91255.1 efflux RND transporter periplasmic adaptor subunit [Caulobacter sp. 17J65-9]
MTRIPLTPRTLSVAAAALVLASGGLGYGLARLQDRPSPTAETPAAGREVLYWYDPMVPGQRFDKPGKSPYMDMPLVPKYADEADAGGGVRIDPARTQNVGMRVVEARRGLLSNELQATGVIDFNQRDVAIVQAKTGGIVQRVYGRAPGDVVAAGAPLADLLVPEWGGAQAEFLAVRRTGDAALVQAARQRLHLLGMPPSLIAEIERSGRPRTVVTVSTPTGGTIKDLGVRAGMTVPAGQTLAEINGLSTVWLDAAVPEAMAGRIRVGGPAQATLAAYPGETFTGRVTQILPQVAGESRTLTARVELPNRGGRLRPGMFATVDLGGGAKTALLVPSEAVIRTGRRVLVMLALEGGRYKPAEVRIGDSTNGQTEILAGLSEGEKVVASGQFLIDSEASLAGMEARPVDAAPASGPSRASDAANHSGHAAPASALHETVGRIEQVTSKSVTLSHEAVPTLGWPAMTMSFRLEDPALVRGLKPGDRVRFAFDQPAAGPTVRRISPLGARP